jgi:cobalt-precorrin 5A hydrolase
MVVGEAMIVAGLGSRKDVTVDEVLAAIHAAADRYGVEAEKIGLLATGEKKASEPAFAEAALRLGLPLEILSDAALEAVGERTLTRSGQSLAVTGVPSLSETSALAAAGPNSALLGPRVALGPVPCALARSGDAA